MRDYRDAKAMAHSLREALAQKAVTLNHSECLELVAKSLGAETWNILSAKIEASAPSPTEAAKPLAEVSEEKRTLYCSFCGKSQHEVQKLIAGPAVFICDGCVRLCSDIIDEPRLYQQIINDQSEAQDYIRGRTDEQLASFLRATRLALAWEKDVLEQTKARLAVADFEAAPPMTAGAARFNSKTREELLALQRSFEASVGPREAAIAAVQAVLDERRKP